jgi:hypothetical protein
MAREKGQRFLVTTWAAMMPTSVGISLVRWWHHSGRSFYCPLNVVTHRTWTRVGTGRPSHEFMPACHESF